MKTGIFLTIFGSIMIILSIIFGVIGAYRYEKEISSYWKLADKSSTLERKLEHTGKFVDALENSGLSGKHNALFLTTPNNSFDLNFEALKTLEQRLYEIKDMDITSFEYQTAMQQITGQESGEANAMLSVFRGVWWKNHFILLWDWIAFTQVIICIIMVLVGSFIWSVEAA